MTENEQEADLRKFKIKLGVILGIIALIIFSFVLYSKLTEYERFLEYCSTTNDTGELFECVQHKVLTPQDQYDIYYKKADYLYDYKFFSAFNHSFNKCSGDATCDLYDKTKIDKVFQKCLDSFDYYCVQSKLKYLRDDYEISQFDIELFNKASSMKLKLNPTSDYIICILEFYNKLNNEQKKQLDDEIIRICEYSKKLSLMNN